MKNTIIIMVSSILLVCLFIFAPELITTRTIDFNSFMVQMEGDWGLLGIFLLCLTVIAFNLDRLYWNKEN